MKQSDQVVDAIKKFGNIATLSQLYNTVGAGWRTQTPAATVRRIVQLDERIHKIKPGLYCLADKKDYYGDNSPMKSLKTFNHTFYQALLLEIGRIRKHDTYVAYHDKNKSFFGSGKLSTKSTVDKLPEFWPKSSSLKIMEKAKTVDVVWLDKKRKMPRAFYEVEMTTDMGNSLGKFIELRDYRADMVIVAPKLREREYKRKISSSQYSDIESIVTFQSTDALLGEAESLLKSVETITMALWKK